MFKIDFKGGIVLDYFIFDGIDSRDYGIYIANKDGQPMMTNEIPPKRTIREQISGYHGEVVFDQYYDTRNIEITCYMKDSSDLTTLRYMRGWLGQLNPRTLTLSYEPYKFYYATFENQMDIEHYNLAGLFTLSFRCYDPFGYSRFSTKDLDSGLIDDKGLFYNSGLLCNLNSMKYNYTSFGTTAQNMLIYHGGNTNLAKPRIKIQGQADDITISKYNLTDSYYSGTVVSSASNTITLDSGAVGNYDGKVIVVSGEGEDYPREINKITSYSSGTQIATLEHDWNINPDNTCEFEIFDCELDKTCSFGSFTGALVIDSEDTNVFTGTSLNDLTMNNITFEGDFFTLNGKIKLNDNGMNYIRIESTSLANVTNVDFEFRYVYL